MNETELMQKRIKRMYAGQIVNRVLLILILIIMICNLAVVGYAGYKVNQFVNMVEPAVEAIMEIDVDELNKTLNTINNAVDVFKIDEALDTIGKIDFEGFGRVISGIDIEKLNDTLDKLDKASEFMTNVGDGLNKFMSQFGISNGKK